MTRRPRSRAHLTAQNPEQSAGADFGVSRPALPDRAAEILRFASDLTTCTSEAEIATLVAKQLRLLFDASVAATLLTNSVPVVTLARTAGLPPPLPVTSLPKVAARAYDSRELVRATSSELEELGRLTVDAAAAPLPSSAGTPLGVLLVATPRPLDLEEPRVIEAVAQLTASGLLNLNRVGRALVEARRDELTGLPNRRAFEEHLELTIKRAQAGGLALTLVLLDLDDFKQINDEHGHVVGDEVLRHFARVAVDTSRATEPIFRIGGEEFAVVVEADAASGAGVADRLRQALNAHRRDRRLPSISAGVASLSTCPSGRDELVARADAALYAAKRAGKNKVLTDTASQPTFSGSLRARPTPEAPSQSPS